MDDLRRALLQLILDRPEIKSDAIFEHPSMQDEESKRISNFLYLLKQAGQAVADEGRHYTITAKGRAWLKSGKDAETETAPTHQSKRPYKRRSSPPLAPERAAGDGVEAILIEAEEHAQAALDRYLTTVGDPNIINPLRIARDAAREALKNHREKPRP